MIEPTEDDLDFARDTLGSDATPDEVLNLANLRLDREARDALAETIAAARMTPVPRRQGGWLFRSATASEIAEAVIKAGWGRIRAKRGGFRAACLAHPDSTVQTRDWGTLLSWCDSHAETVPHDGRWPVTYRTNVGAVYREPVRRNGDEAES